MRLGRLFRGRDRRGSDSAPAPIPTDPAPAPRPEPAREISSARLDQALERLRDKIPAPEEKRETPPEG